MKYLFALDKFVLAILSLFCFVACLLQVVMPCAGWKQPFFRACVPRSTEDLHVTKNGHDMLVRFLQLVTAIAVFKHSLRSYQNSTDSGTKAFRTRKVAAEWSSNMKNCKRSLCNVVANPIWMVKSPERLRVMAKERHAWWISMMHVQSMSQPRNRSWFTHPCPVHTHSLHAPTSWRQEVDELLPWPFQYLE